MRTDQNRLAYLENGDRTDRCTIHIKNMEKGELLPDRIANVYLFGSMEWSRAEQRVSVRHGTRSSISLQILREVDTTGFIVADTHIHTPPLSGHGDANISERLVTLAGAGIEFAVATDPHHNTR